MHSLFFLIISPLLPLRVVAAAPLWAAPWRATNHSHQARTVRQHPLSTSLSLSHCLLFSCYFSISPPTRQATIKSLLNKRAHNFCYFCNSIKPNSLYCVHFWLQENRPEWIESWKLKTESPQLSHMAWAMTFTEMASTSHVAGCDCWSWRTVSWPTHHSVAATHIELKMTVFCFLELEVLVAVIFLLFVFLCLFSAVFNFQRANTKWT